MKLAAATMIISRVCVYHFERFERALKNVSDEIRLSYRAEAIIAPARPLLQRPICDWKTVQFKYTRGQGRNLTKFFFGGGGARDCPANILCL